MLDNSCSVNFTALQLTIQKCWMSAAQVNLTGGLQCNMHLFCRRGLSNVIAKKIEKKLYLKEKKKKMELEGEKAEKRVWTLTL